MISGRLLNRWWRNLSHEEKSRIIKKYKHHTKLLAFFGTSLVGYETWVYYRSIEICPYTGRKRFMILTKEDMKEILGEPADNELLQKSSVLSSNHPYYKSVKSIVDTIIVKNKEVFPELSGNWKLLIYDDDSIINAACLPNGEIIVYTGLIKFVENHHQLAVVISHELSHVILEHGLETLGRMSILSIIVTVCGFALWTFVQGDFMAFLSNWLKNRIFRVCLELPYNRMLESEADVLGLQMLARSCYDVNEAKKFWDIMSIFEKKTEISLPNWLCTHPLSELRAKHLERLTPSASKLSKECGCLVESSVYQKILHQYKNLVYF